jgi:hypothetical protein
MCPDTFLCFSSLWRQKTTNFVATKNSELHGKVRFGFFAFAFHPIPGGGIGILTLVNTCVTSLHRLGSSD